MPNCRILPGALVPPEIPSPLEANRPMRDRDRRLVLYEFQRPVAGFVPVQENAACASRVWPRSLEIGRQLVLPVAIQFSFYFS
jgi:hypothetical protein